jgi:hypothetical protein
LRVFESAWYANGDRKLTVGVPNKNLLNDEIATSCIHQWFGVPQTRDPKRWVTSSEESVEYFLHAGAEQGISQAPNLSE